VLETINDKIKIQALCNLHNTAFPCSGFVEIQWIEKQEAYVSWQMFDENSSNIAGKSQRYFLGAQPCSKDEIIEMAIRNIEKFRLDRKCIFSDVKIAVVDS
jgi:hypothetical protein